MKRLVVLILFMFMASLASATPVVTGDITWTVNNYQLLGTGTATDVTLKQNLMLANYGESSSTLSIANTGYPANGLLSNGVSAAAGNLGKNQLMGTTGFMYYEVYAQDAAGAGQTADVVWFTFDIDTLVPTYIHIYASDFSSVLGTIEVVGVPEPMTMALLGLGGLFLRRRKK